MPRATEVTTKQDQKSTCSARKARPRQKQEGATREGKRGKEHDARADVANEHTDV